MHGLARILETEERRFDFLRNCKGILFFGTKIIANWSHQQFQLLEVRTGLRVKRCRYMEAVGDQVANLRGSYPIGRLLILIQVIVGAPTSPPVRGPFFSALAVEKINFDTSSAAVKSLPAGLLVRGPDSAWHCCRNAV